MTDRLNGPAPTSTKLSAQELCDRGNRILAGIEPMTGKKNQGQFMYRSDVHWFLQDGRPVIGWVR